MRWVTNNVYPSIIRKLMKPIKWSYESSKKTWPLNLFILSLPYVSSIFFLRITCDFKIYKCIQTKSTVTRHLHAWDPTSGNRNTTITVVRETEASTSKNNFHIVYLTTKEFAGDHKFLEGLVKDISFKLSPTMMSILKWWSYKMRMQTVVSHKN